MPATAIGALETRVLTRVVNKRAKSHMFLMNLLFPPSTYRTINRSTIQYDELTENKYMAPFTTVNGDAAMLKGETGDSVTVTTPHIHLKDPIQPSDEMFLRIAGETDILQGQDDVMGRYIEQEILRGTDRMEMSIQEREEWMVSQSLQGAISYKVENRANFTMTLNKPAANTITPVAARFWDTSTAKPHQDLDSIIKRRNNEVNGPRLTDAICGLQAADALRDLVESDILKLSTERATTLRSQFEFGNDFDSDSGVIYLGVINNIRFWEYAEKVKDEDGVETDLIRSKYIEFVSRTSAALQDREMIYGAIQDLTAIRSNQHINRRFAKTVLSEEPSSLTTHLFSRPLPLFYRPDHLISFKAVSG